MVARPTYILAVLSVINCVFCRLGCGTIYIFLILMKEVIHILNRVARTVNKWIVWTCLLMAYAVICVYRLFLKKDNKRWHMKEKDYNELEQTKHLW